MMQTHLQSEFCENLMYYESDPGQGGYPTLKRLQGKIQNVTPLFACARWAYINTQNKNQAWSEGETKNNKQKIYIG